MVAVSHELCERIQQDISQTKRGTVENGIQIFLLSATVDTKWGIYEAGDDVID